MQIHGGEGKTENIKLDFSVNIDPLGMPKAVLDAWQSLASDPSALEVYPDRNCEKLRRAAAKHYRVSEDWVVCGCGASELIYKIAYRYRGCRALVISPGFGEYEKALREAGCLVRTVELKKERGFVFDKDFLERFCRAVEDIEKYDPEKSAPQNPTLVFLCSPNNPVGGRIPVGMLRKMLYFCMHRGIRVVVDECFLPFVTGDEPTIDFMKECAKRKNTTESSPDDEKEKVFEGSSKIEKKKVFGDPAETEKGKSFKSTVEDGKESSKEEFVSPVIIKALTKSHAIPGVRLGLAISSDTKLIRELQGTGAPWTVSGIAEKLGEAAFDGWDEKEFDNMRETVAAERAYLERGLTEAGAKVYFGEGNFILFSVPGGNSLFSFMRDHGILIRSCESFGLGTEFYRIAVRTREENRCFLENFLIWSGGST